MTVLSSVLFSCYFRNIMEITCPKTRETKSSCDRQTSTLVIEVQRLGGGRCLQKLFDAIGELSAFAGPIIDALTLEVDGSGVGAGVVGAYHFQGAAIAGTILLNDDNTVIRLLAGAKTRQTDHQHS